MDTPFHNANSVDGVTVPDDGLGVEGAGAGTGVPGAGPGGVIEQGLGGGGDGLDQVLAVPDPLQQQQF